MQSEEAFELETLKRKQALVKGQIGNSTKPLAIVITARSDPNAVYKKHKGYFRQNRNQLLTHGFEVIEIEDVADPTLIEAILQDVPKGRINFFWLRAHGSPKSMEFSKDHNLTNENLGKVFSWLPEKLDSNATIFLESCKTASLEKDFYNNMLFSFGRLTQSMLDVSIIAPVQDSYMDKFSIDEHNQFRFVGRGPYLTTKALSDTLRMLDKATKVLLSNSEIEEITPELTENLRKSLKGTTGSFAYDACLKYLEQVNMVHIQALHLAISKNDFYAVKELLTEFQADPNEINLGVTDLENFLPLNKAIERKNINIIKLLLDMGANIFQEYKGVTPFSYLLEQGYNSSDTFYIEAIRIFELHLKNRDNGLYQRFIEERERYRIYRGRLDEDARVLLQYSHKQQVHTKTDDPGTAASAPKPKKPD